MVTVYLLSWSKFQRNLLLPSSEYKAAGSSEMLVPIYQTTRRQISEYHNLTVQRRENLASHLHYVREIQKENKCMSS
jgi:hypothetical protein